MKVSERLLRTELCFRSPGTNTPRSPLSLSVVRRILAGLMLSGLLLIGCDSSEVGEKATVSPDTGAVPRPSLPPPSQPAPVEKVTPPATVTRPPSAFDRTEREEVARDELPEMAAPDTDELPSYPWPPEAPSSLVSLSDLYDFSVGGSASLFDVSESLRTALRESGYLERRFYAAPGGFVMVTRLEQTDEQGTPLPDGKRYLLPEDAGDFSFAAYIHNLFFAPEGYYRFIAFVVTDRTYTTSDSALAEDTALARLRGGSVALPSAFRDLPFSDHHRVDALIYEFRLAVPNASVEPVTPGRLPPETHLEHSGLAGALRSMVHAR